ncbi:MAG: leucine-rich repeat domain-containing protein [Candidatus Lokiarchaeota archaeon]|nr:leucine-rich repeat domain-containing protein [Candidatus Lokiarchaeota archaeon]
MPRLACLRIYGTIPEFPDAILDVKRLKELHIAGVGMERFPASEKSVLVALEVLDISKNPITELPGWLFPGDSMRRLDASHTKIKGLPDCIGRWKDLEVLDASNSELEALPDAIGNCKRLRELAVHNTMLQALPDAIGGCVALEKLKLGGTRIREVPAGIGGCASLQVLDVSRTAVKELPAEILRCENLKKVYHRHLHRSAVPPALWDDHRVEFVQDRDMAQAVCPVRDDYDWC